MALVSFKVKLYEICHYSLLSLKKSRTIKAKLVKSLLNPPPFYPDLLQAIVTLHIWLWSLLFQICERQLFLQLGFFSPLHSSNKIQQFITFQENAYILYMVKLSFNN